MLYKPRFAHDCSCCIFLGHTREQGSRVADLYYCVSVNKKTKYSTLLARFSDEPSDYESGHPKFYNPATDSQSEWHPHMTEAYLKACNLKEFVA